MRRKLLLIVLVLYFFCSAKVYANSQFQDGNYEVQINLWHIKDDKLSMGNKSLKNKAEIEVKDGRYFLYIETEKIKVQNIESSLLNFFYEDEDGNFRKAEEACYDIEIKDEINKRPRIFKIPLNNLDEYHQVLVDPKVAVMGRNPLPARLKINIDSIKSIKEEEAGLINDFNNSIPKEIIYKKNDYKVCIEYDKDSFNKDFDFYAEEYDENRKLDLKRELQGINLINAYNIEAQAKLDLVPKDKLTKINEIRENIQPENEVLLILEGDFPDNLNIMDLDNKKDIQFKKEDKKILIKTSKLGKFALISNNEKDIKNINNEKKPNNYLKKKSKEKIKPKKAVKPEKIKKTENNNLNTHNIEDKNIMSKENQIKPEVEEKTQNEIVYENYHIILLVVLFFVFILYVSIYNIIKYDRKLQEELVIYNELKRKENRFERKNH